MGTPGGGAAPNPLLVPNWGAAGRRVVLLGTGTSPEPGAQSSGSPGPAVTQVPPSAARWFLFTDLLFRVGGTGGGSRGGGSRGGTRGKRGCGNRKAGELIPVLPVPAQPKPGCLGAELRGEWGPGGVRMLRGCRDARGVSGCSGGIRMLGGCCDARGVSGCSGGVGMLRGVSGCSGGIRMLKGCLDSQRVSGLCPPGVGVGQVGPHHPQPPRPSEEPLWSPPNSWALNE